MNRYLLFICLIALPFISMSQEAKYISGPLFANLKERPNRTIPLFETASEHQKQRLEIASITSVSGPDLVNGLIASYPFCGNAHDISGNGYNGTVTGTVIYSSNRFSEDSGAFSFDGNTFIRTQYAGVSGGASRTFNVWIKPDISFSDEYQYLMTYGEGINYYEQMRFGINFNQSEQMTVDIGGAAYGKQCQGIYDGKWHMLTYVIPENANPDDVNLYMDGKLLSVTSGVCCAGSESTAIINTVIDNPASSHKMNLGVFEQNTLHNPFYISYFRGEMDDVRFFDKELDLSEIQLLYTSSDLCNFVVPPTCPGVTSAISGSATVCSGSINGYTVNSLSGITYTWSIPGMGVVGSGNSAIVNFEGTGSKILYAIPSNSCAGKSSVTINLLDSTFSVLSAPKITTECIDAVLSVSSSLPNNRYMWSTGETSATITVKNPGTYTIRTYNNCVQKTDTINVTIKRQEDHIPNVITPNGDGINDTFTYSGCFAYNTDFILIVYSRWGNKVYQSIHYDLNWNADGVSDGLYYYSLTDIKTGEVIKGWLDIIR